MDKPVLSVAAPWTLIHERLANGCHPLGRSFFDFSPEYIKLNVIDNVKLQHRFDTCNISESFVKEVMDNFIKLKKFPSNSINKIYEDFFWPPNRAMATYMPGDIEFIHTLLYPSMTRPYVFFLESIGPMFHPFSSQGGGIIQNQTVIRHFYRPMLESPLCLGIFSQLSETCLNVKKFFSSPVIDGKVFKCGLGISEKSFYDQKIRDIDSLKSPRFFFMNSAHQNSGNFPLRGGHITLRFWEKYISQGRTGLLIMRCEKPTAETMIKYGINADFLRNQSGKTIIWLENYLDTKNMNTLLANVHFFLLPSVALHSASIMQSMILGAVPIVTDTFGPPEYVSDGETGVILKGVKDAIWVNDPETNIEYDTFVMPNELEESLISQMLERVSHLSDNFDEYKKIRVQMLEHAQKNCSGQKSSQDFWAHVYSLYENFKKNYDVFEKSPTENSDSFEDCLVSPDNWARFFESPANRVAIPFDGPGLMYEVGGEFVHLSHQNNGYTEMSAMSNYFNINSPRIDYFSSIEDMFKQFPPS